MADPKAGVDTQTPIEKPAATPAPAPDPDSPDPKPEPRTYTQEDLDRITSKVRRNTRREVERAVTRELAARQPPPTKEAAPTEDKEPQRDAFDNYEDYARDLAKFEGRKAAREENAAAEKTKRETTERESQEKAARTWHAKIEKAIDKHDDFEDVLEDNDETVSLIQGSPMRSAITESDIGPEIVYHLCQHPEEAKRIAALKGYKQAAEIAKIEDTLTAAPKPKGEEEADEDAEPDEEKPAPERRADGTFKPKKEPSKAPEPIEPVGERSANTSNLPSDKDDAETWRRKELARMRRLQGK